MSADEPILCIPKVPSMISESRTRKSLQSQKTGNNWKGSFRTRCTNRLEGVQDSIVDSILQASQREGMTGKPVRIYGMDLSGTDSSSELALSE